MALNNLEYNELISEPELTWVTTNRFPRMAKPLLFVDLDGACLNDHTRYTNGYCGASPVVVDNFNKIIDEVDPLLVITSAWRYFVLRGEMTVKGLEECLLTHGVNCKNRVASVTRPDIKPLICDRGPQISDWIRQNGGLYSQPYVVIDDLDLQIRDSGHPFRQTYSGSGLTKEDANEVVEMIHQQERSGVYD